MPAWIGAVLVLGPLIFAATLATARLRRAHRGRRITTVPTGWVRARGVVVDERPRPLGRRGSAGARQPVVTYQTADGREVTFVSRLHGEGMPRPGTLIAVYHDPRKPTRACIAPEALVGVSLPMPAAARVGIALIWAFVLLVAAMCYFVLLNL